MTAQFAAKGTRRAFVYLGVVAAVAIVGLLATLISSRPMSDTVEEEIIHICMQLLVVSVLGVFVTMATFDLQQARLDRIQKDAEKREEDRVTSRRRDDHALDEQLRIDDRVREFLAETIGAYNSVKRVRRLLEAETLSPTGPAITRKPYSVLLADLCDQQLVFESLCRRAPLIQGKVAGAMSIRVVQPIGAEKVERPVGTLEEHYGHVETYLNEIVEEYQKNLSQVPGNGNLPLVELPQLDGFVYTTRQFKNQVSWRVEGIIRCLEKDLMTSKTPLSERYAAH